MSSTRAQESQIALKTNRDVASRYYNVAIPSLRSRMDEINRALETGEPAYMREAFQGQRGALTEGLSQKAGVASAQQAAGSKKALSGGNFAATLNPADFGAQLANALYGSRFAEGQANLDQQFNLMNMALGGAGTAGSGALGAAQNQLNAISFLPQYNPTYANVVGGLAGASSIYGALNNYGAFGGGVPWSLQGGTPPVGPPTTSYGGTPGFG